MSVLVIMNQLNFYYKNLWESDLINFIKDYPEESRMLNLISNLIKLAILPHL